MSFQYTDTQEEIRKAVSRLCEDFGPDYWRKCDDVGAYPEEFVTAMTEAGWLGALIPEEYGGSGLSVIDGCLILQEVNRSGGNGASCHAQMYTMASILNHGSDAQKRKYLPRIADGSLRLQAFGVTEPDAGSNTHKVSTYAVRRGTGWVINGAKYWTSDIDQSQAVMVVARDGVPVTDGSRQGLSLFVVPTSTPGISMTRIDSALRTSEKQFTVFFDNVEIPGEALIGEPGAGLKQVFAGLNPERIAAAAINNGISRFAIAQAAQYAADRSVWKTPIGAHQGVAHPLAEAYINVQAARLLNARAAQLCDGGEDAAETANMAKFAAAEASLKALDQAIQVHGGNGLSNEYGLSDLWFIARLHRTAPVSREMILNYISTHSLGLPKSY